jgi:hypothetical protein
MFYKGDECFRKAMELDSSRIILLADLARYHIKKLRENAGDPVMHREAVQAYINEYLEAEPIHPLKAWCYGQLADMKKYSGEQNEASDDIILSMLIAATVLINFFVVRALLTGRDTRKKLLHGLVAMYKDNNVEKYYDDSLLSAYGFRYKLFVAVLLILAVIAIFVPLLIRIFT